MSECSALATKPELREKLDKSEKSQIINVASSIGASIAIGTTDPQIRAALAKLATLAGQVGRVVGQIVGLIARVTAVFSLIASLASIAMVTILQLRVSKLESQVRGLTILANDAFKAANTATTKSNQAINKANQAAVEANYAASKANTATERANDATNRANVSLLQANVATDNANRAYNESQIAKAQASRAETRANTAIATSNVATDNANAARTEADIATREANEANRKADVAIFDANAASSVANTAITKTTTLEAENRDLKALVFNLQTEVKTLKSSESSKDSKLGQLLTLISSKVGYDVFNSVTGNKAAKNEVEVLKQETQQERLRREYKERLDLVHVSQAELREQRQQKINSKFKSQTELQLELARRALNKQKFDDTKTKQQLESRVQTLEKTLREEQQSDSESRGTTVVIPRGGLSVAQVNNIVNTQVTTQVGNLERVNEQQYKDILDKLNGVPVLTGAVVAGGLAPALTPIRNGIQQLTRNTAPSVVSQAVATGVCSTTQPGGCMQRNVVDRLTGNMGNLVNAGGTAFSAANNALLIRMQGTLNAVRATTNVIKGTTNTTLGVVTHAKHGLQAVQSFASTAWKATHADKILNGVSTALAIHNAVMLSNNLGVTIGEAASVTLQAMGINDSNGNPFDVNQILRAKMTSLITSVLGRANHEALTAKIAKANRIYQTGINLLDTTYSLFDSARTVAELTAENTGKIGNALRESGAVYEDAYDEFLEKVNPQNTAMRKLGSFRDTIEVAENAFNTVTEISGAVVETKENIAQIKAEKQTLKSEVETFLNEQKTEKDTAKIQVQVTTEVTDNDFDRATEEI